MTMSNDVPDGRFSRTIIALGFGVVAIAGCAIRLNLMALSLWEDEAWVANSVLSPSIRGMFYYPPWLQTSPPLFLFLLRISAAIFGRGEIALRLVPWLAGAASVVLIGIVLARLFPVALALLGTVFFVTNYWAVKYAQQAKQYSGELLVSTLFLFVLLNYLQHGQKQRTFWVLVLTGGLGVFLSYSAIFWFPVALLAIATFSSPTVPGSQGIDAAKQSFHIRLSRSLIALVAYIAGLGLLDVLFVRPNRAPSLMNWWKDNFIGSGGLLSSIWRFLVCSCDLMAPQRFAWSRPLSFTLGLVTLAGLMRATVAAIRGDSRARNLLFVTGLPVLVALVVSAFRQYPLLTYPRMIIWMLPLCTVLLVYAAEPLWKLVAAKIGTPASATVAGGIALFLCAFAIYFDLFVTARTNGQDPRSAVSYLKNNAERQDPLFVRALTTEQFTYYGESLHWAQPLYVGNTNLPCCLRNRLVIQPHQAELGFAQDIHSFSELAAGKRAWFLLERGEYQQMTRTIQDEMSSAGCRSREEKNFENLSLVHFDCAAPVAARASSP